MANRDAMSPPRMPLPPLQFPRLPRWALRLGLLPLLVLLGVCYWWFVQRVEVPPGNVLVLVRKVGAWLPAQATDTQGQKVDLSEQVVLYPALLAALGEPPGSTRYKGVVFETLAEGRYFYDPFLWERIVVPAIAVPQNQVGIRIRKYGHALPPGKTVATEPDERGPEFAVLPPARYNINPYAHDVRLVPPVIIQAGQVGVQVLLAGREPNNPNQFVVATGERGVQPDVLPPGMYYNNPYRRRIDPIDVRSHTIELSGKDAIRFPSNDSFDILVDCTVEYAVREDMAPTVLVALGGHEDIREKLILPYVRSLSRIEGSKLVAREFISGDTRTTFQNAVLAGLRSQCATQGIDIRSALIRRIDPPTEIAGPIRDRQVAGQQVKQYENEIRVAKAEALLVQEKELQAQNTAIGAAKRDVVTVVATAEQERTVAVTAAKQRLQVAELQLKAAHEKAAAILSRGAADADVMRLQYEAQAKPLRDAVAAFGGGEAYAQYFFFAKLAPALKTVLASTDGPLAEVFRALAPGQVRSTPPPARDLHPESPPRAAPAALPPATQPSTPEGGA